MEPIEEDADQECIENSYGDTLLSLLLKIETFLFADAEESQ